MQLFRSTSQWAGLIGVLFFVAFEKSLQIAPAFPILQFGLKGRRASSGAFFLPVIFFFFNLVWPAILQPLQVHLCKCLFSPREFVHDYIAEAFGCSLCSCFHMNEDVFSESRVFKDFFVHVQSC